MKTITILMAALALSFSAAAPAGAAEISKSEITRILSDHGYAVRDFDANMVSVVVGQHIVLIGVHGADGDITYITYLSGVSGATLGYDFLNRFNNEVKFGRAYVDSDGDVALQMDRNAAGGVSAQNIESDFEVFQMLIEKFLTDLEAQAIA